MKTISANPDFFEIAHNWAAANPMEFFWVGTVTLMVVCYKLKDAF